MAADQGASTTHSRPQGPLRMRPGPMNATTIALQISQSLPRACSRSCTKTVCLAALHILEGEEAQWITVKTSSRAQIHTQACQIAFSRRTNTCEIRSLIKARRPNLSARLTCQSRTISRCGTSTTTTHCRGYNRTNICTWFITRTVILIGVHLFQRRL